MRRYPGNHTDSELLTVPRNLKTRPQAPTTHLAYITDDEAELLKEYKPGTPHEGAEGIPNYDTWGIDKSGTVTGGSTAGGGGGWSGDTGGGQSEPEPWSGSPPNNISDAQDLISVNQDPYGGYKTAQQQMAASLQAAGAVTSGALGGQALWTKAPKKWIEELIRKGGDPNLYDNEYYSSFAEGTQAYSPSGIIKITGEGGIPAYIGRDKYGNLIPNPDPRANKYQVVNPFQHGPRADEGGGGGWGSYGYGGGYGGGGGGGGGGYIEQELPPRGNPNEAWGAQTPWQQIMINTHAGKGFQQGYARGGIVGFVT